MYVVVIRPCPLARLIMSLPVMCVDTKCHIMITTVLYNVVNVICEFIFGVLMC